MRLIRNYSNCLALLAVMSVATWGLGCADSATSGGGGAATGGGGAAAEEGGHDAEHEHGHDHDHDHGSTTGGSDTPE